MILSQEDQEYGVNSVAFFSMQDTQEKNSVHYSGERMLVIDAALKHFVAYILGRRFVILIDLHAMKHLNSMRNTNGHLTCWALVILPFIFDDHHSSKFNTNADASLGRVETTG